MVIHPRPSIPDSLFSTPEDSPADKVLRPLCAARCSDLAQTFRIIQPCGNAGKFDGALDRSPPLCAGLGYRLFDRFKGHVAHWSRSERFYPIQTRFTKVGEHQARISIPVGVNESSGRV